VAKISNEELVKIIKCSTQEERKPFLEQLYFNLLGLMKKIIKPFLCFTEEDELLNECFFGLISAIDGYEENKGQFSSYACFWFKQCILRYLEDSGFIIRIPVHFRQKIRHYKRAVETLSNELGRAPTDWEVAQYMGVEFAEIQDIKLHQCNLLSLDVPIDNDDGKEMSFADTIASEFCLENEVIEEVYTEYEKNALWGILERSVSASEYRIIEEFYKKGKAGTQIAEEMNLPYNKVRNLKESGLRKLRYGQGKKEILDSLEIAEAGQYRCGLNNFKEHLESKTEYLAMKRIEARENYK